MSKDLLPETLSLIEKWCNANGVFVFYGSVEKTFFTKVSWDVKFMNDWEKFLQFIKITSTPILIVDIITNNLDINDENIKDYREGLEDDELNDFEKSIKVVKKNQGFIAYYELSFISDNVCYSYTHLTDWVDDFLIIQSVIENDENEIDSKTPRLPKPIKLVDEQVESIARKVTSDEKYLNANTPLVRSEIAKMIIEQEGITDFFNKYNVRRRVELIYETEIRPTLEKKIRENVLDLKLKGFKKVQIASKLGISSGMVDKFYNSDDN